MSDRCTIYPLRDVCNLIGGHAFSSHSMVSTPERYQIIKMGNLYGGRLDLSRNPSFIDNIEKNSLKVLARPNDILITLTGTIGKRDYGNACIIDRQENLLVNQRVCIVRPDQSRVDPFYLYCVITSENFLDNFFDLSIGGTGTQTNVSIKALGDLEIAVPNITSQKAIAAMVRTWDEAIEKLKALVSSKKRLHEARSAKLIYNGGYQTRPLREHVIEVSERNRGQQVNRILSVTNSAGFVLADEQFAHRVASVDISNYKIVRRRQYAYNPSRINVGSIARLDMWDVGALSPMYVVFELDSGLAPDFFDHWLHSAEARKRISSSAQGSVRDSVSFSDLASISIPLPPREKQLRIADVLNAGRREIRLMEEQAGMLTRQKRGLMQKLLTGEWRVGAYG